MADLHQTESGTTNSADAETGRAQALATPLCVDLDGTLIRGDMLHEAVLAFAKSAPLNIFRLIWWLLAGKVQLKRKLSQRVQIDPAILPYRQDLLAFLHTERAEGRAIHLVTASPRPWAEAVAGHLGLFDVVEATDDVNLRGNRKGELLVRLHGLGSYDYVGDSRADRAVWQTARQVLRAGRGTRLRAVSSMRDFPDVERRAAELMRALRPHQWLKNVLVAVPLLASHRLSEVPLLITIVMAFAAFSFAASATYILNDLLDLDADRRHPRKRQRPFASGSVSISSGVAMGVILLVMAALVATALAPAFAAVLAFYMVATTLYSLRLKRAPLLDVFTLAGLYSLRVLAGSVATGIQLSEWLLAFSMFLFLALAIIKRCGELAGQKLSDVPVMVAGRGYYAHDRAVLEGLGAASSFASVLVLAIYTSQARASQLYESPDMLWLVCPLLLYWLSRCLLLAGRGHMHDDPLVFAIRDRISLYLVGICACLALFATWVQVSF